ncbi:MAG: hypothetical protein HY538_05550 [Deltaproteobacteria bacterium]|nr:hypothetical protein [Deltaproteobacteria bacterium]
MKIPYLKLWIQVVRGLIALALGMAPMVNAAEPLAQKTVLIHLKTGLDLDDAQLCVAYNQIWAAAETGQRVQVLVDASAVKTYKKGWLGGNELEDYEIPEDLRRILSKEFHLPLEKIPRTYGEYLRMLHAEGVEFFINSEMLVTYGIEKEYGKVENLAVDFFKPVGIQEALRLVTNADIYLVY